MGRVGGDLAPRLQSRAADPCLRCGILSPRERGLPRAAGSGQRAATSLHGTQAPRLPGVSRPLSLLEGDPSQQRRPCHAHPLASLQVTLLSVEMTALKEERDRLRVTSEDKEPKEQLQKAVRDRDEAIAK